MAWSVLNIVNIVLQSSTFMFACSWCEECWAVLFNDESPVNRAWVDCGEISWWWMESVGNVLQTLGTDLHRSASLRQQSYLFTTMWLHFSCFTLGQLGFKTFSRNWKKYVFSIRQNKTGVTDAVFR